MEDKYQDRMDDCQQYFEEAGYAANPFCEVCNGVGKLHPLKLNGMTDYSAAVQCSAPGCMADSYHKHESGDRGLIAHGLTSYRSNFDTWMPAEGTELCLTAFTALADGTGKPWLLCYGGCGSGKTHLCEAAVIRLNQRGVNAWYFTVAGLMATLKAPIGRDGLEVFVQSISSLPGLALDDWGAEQGTDFDLSMMERIIDERYRRRLITVLASNRSLEQMILTSQRIVSRFSDAEIGVIVVNSAGDFRRKKSQYLPREI